MAPTSTSHDRFLFALLRPLVHLQRRDASESISTPSSTVAGFAAAIAILGAIILGYVTYRGVKWYRARGRSHQHSASSPHSVRSTRFKQNGLPAEITIANSNYGHFPSMSQSKFSQVHSRHDHDTEAFSPPLHTASSAVNGVQPSQLDWRPPVLTPWAPKHEHSLGGSDSASDVEAQRVQVNHVRGPSYPSQAYGQGRGKSGGMFGFMRNAANGFAGGRRKGGKDEDGMYLMVNGSPPVGSPPPQYLTKTNNGYDGAGAGADMHGASHNEAIGAHLRDLGGAGSPPLPPLPPVTPAPFEPPRKSADRTSPTATPRPSNAGPTKSIPAPINLLPAPINLLPAPPSSTSRPLSRAPTTKSYRLTGSSHGHGAVPSPRVSSLFRASSRLSHHHGYTAASPGLPNPPFIPPIPALPAHLFRGVSLSKASSDGRGSMDTNPRHDSSLSSSTINGGEAGAAAGVDGSEDPTKGPDGKPLPRTMVVTCTFTPGLSDELPLQIGETVSMLEEYIDEWCFVQRVRVIVKDSGSRGLGGVMVGVHGTVDAQNTTTVPVAGEGNLGAVPRFCLSEWPLAIPEEEEEQKAITLGQETPTGLPMFTPPTLLPSPPATSTTPTFTPNRMDMAHQPLVAPSSFKQQALGTPRSRPLPIPTPKPPVIQEHLDSKFSSWGSTATQMPPPAQTLSSLSTMQSNNYINKTPSTAPFPSVPGPELANSSDFSSNSIHPLAGSTSGHIHPLSTDSRTPSVSSAATSLTVPVVPPTSPESQSPSVISPAEDDNIRRVSKPPLAPRLSRFPPTPDEEEPSMPTHQRGHSRSGSKGGDNGIPRAAERTVTMPPLPRRPSATDPSTADSPTVTPTQPQHSAPAYATTTNTGISSEVAAWGAGIFPSRDHSLPNMMMMTPPLASSGSSSVPNSGMGTSAGSKTPSTAAPSSVHSSPAGKAAFSKRATSAAQVSRSGSFNGPARVSIMGASGSSFGARIGGGGGGATGSEKKPPGAGALNFKALRTGSSTAGVGPTGRG